MLWSWSLESQTTKVDPSNTFLSETTVTVEFVSENNGFFTYLCRRVASCLSILNRHYRQRGLSAVGCWWSKATTSGPNDGRAALPRALIGSRSVPPCQTSTNPIALSLQRHLRRCKYPCRSPSPRATIAPRGFFDRSAPTCSSRASLQQHKINASLVSATVMSGLQYRNLSRSVEYSKCDLA